MIVVNNLEKSFLNGKLHILKGISTKIEKGEKVVIIGPSGSGKSTFLRCLNLLETPDSGSIVFEGTDITDKKTDINKFYEEKMQKEFLWLNILYLIIGITEKTNAFSSENPRSGEDRG